VAPQQPQPEFEPLVLRCVCCGYLMHFDFDYFRTLRPETEVFCPMCGKNTFNVGAVIQEMLKRRAAIT